MSRKTLYVDDLMDEILERRGLQVTGHTARAELRKLIVTQLVNMLLPRLYIPELTKIDGVTKKDE